MYLPEYVRQCIDKLENAGFAAYAVGGCVRDACLGRTPHDYDLCTSALPEQIREVFRDRRLILAGMKHGTVTVIAEEAPVEITTFRSDGEYLDNRHPAWVDFVPEVEGDLARRDFTINAMAYSPTRGYADPFGGREDLAANRLRAVGNPALRFREDSLRILRGIRFAARYGMVVEPATEQAMGEEAHLMENLARERVFDELCRLLPHLKAADVVRFAPVLAAVIPELGPLIGFDQHSPHHAYDLLTHVAHVVENVGPDLALRWAALLHDVGKVPTFTRDATGRGHFYGHAEESARMADGILRRLKAPTALREQVVLLVKLHMTPVEPEEKLLRRRLSRLGWENLEKLLIIHEADMGSKGTGKEENMDQFVRIRGRWSTFGRRTPV